MEQNKTKKYYLSYVNYDNGQGKIEKKEVEFASDNIYDYEKLYCGDIVRLIEVDTKTNEEKILHQFIFVNEEMSIQFFGKKNIPLSDETDGEYRSYFVLVNLDDSISSSGIAYPARIKVSDFIIVDGVHYIENYDQEHAKRVAEKKAQEEAKNNNGAGQPGDDNN